MTGLIGHALRILGILIEMLGVWGVYTAAQGGKMPEVQLPSGRVVSIAWIAVGLGFALWLVGMLIVSFSRRPSRRLDRDDEELEA